MWRLRFLGKMKTLRKFVKVIFSLVYSHGRVVSILFGPLSNYKWVCNKDHQFWMPLGFYEKETTQWLMKSINTGNVFFDIGANAGYFSLLGSKCVGEEGKVISFEPIPSNCKTIHEHLVENNINNVVVERLAVSKDTGKVSFTIEHNNANSHLESISLIHAPAQPKDTFQVNSISLDEFITHNGIVPNIIKVDVEGAEKLVLEGSTALLRDFSAKWIITLHTSELYKDCKSIMEQNGYEVESFSGYRGQILCRKNIRNKFLQS